MSLMRLSIPSGFLVAAGRDDSAVGDIEIHICKAVYSCRGSRDRSKGDGRVFARWRYFLERVLQSIEHFMQYPWESPAAARS